MPSSNKQKKERLESEKNRKRMDPGVWESEMQEFKGGGKKGTPVSLYRSEQRNISYFHLGTQMLVQVLIKLVWLPEKKNTTWQN